VFLFSIDHFSKFAVAINNPSNDVFVPVLISRTFIHRFVADFVTMSGKKNEHDAIDVLSFVSPTRQHHIDVDDDDVAVVERDFSRHNRPSNHLNVVVLMNRSSFSVLLSSHRNKTIKTVANCAGSREHVLLHHHRRHRVSPTKRRQILRYGFWNSYCYPAAIVVV
jgi:hypothetical protein